MNLIRRMYAQWECQKREGHVWVWEWREWESLSLLRMANFIIKTRTIQILTIVFMFINSQSSPSPEQPAPSPSHTRKKFQFSTSAATLPKQHHTSQFLNLIDNKKNYQSMIKDQLKRLEMMDAQIVDPEVQDFVIEPAKVNSGRINTEQQTQKHRTTLGNKDEPDRSRKSKKVISEQDVYVEEYFNRQPDQRAVEKLQLNVLRNNLKGILNCLRAHYKYSKQNKATKYFRAQNLVKKSFFTIKQHNSYKFQPDEHTEVKLKALKKFLIVKNMNIMVNSTKRQHLKKVSGKYVERKKYETKKSTLVSLLRQIRSNKLIAKKQSSLIKSKQKMAVSFMKSEHAKRVQEQNNVYSLQTLRMRRSLNVFMQNSQQMISCKNYDQEEMISKMAIERQKRQQKHFSIEKYGKIQGWSQNFIDYVKVKLQDTEHQKQIEERVKGKKVKQFIYLLSFNQKLSKLRETQQKAQKVSKKIHFFQKFKQISILQVKKNKIITNHILARLQVFRKNSNDDLKLHRSLNQCLYGSKEWLIKNKHIFKAYPKNVENVSEEEEKRNQSELIQMFEHPMKDQSNMKLLQTQSKFKKVSTRFAKIQFFRRLSEQQSNYQKQLFITSTMRERSNRRMLLLVFNLLKDRLRIEEIQQEIQEEQQASPSEEDNLKSHKIGQLLKQSYQIHFIKELKRQGEFKMKISTLSLKMQRIRKQRFFLTLNIHKNECQNQQFTFQKLGSLQSFLRSEKCFHFVKLLSENKQHCQKQKDVFTKLETINPTFKEQSAKGDRHISPMAQIHQFSKQQFLKLLSINSKINKNSVEITSNYLQNRSKQLISNIIAIQHNSKVRAQLEDKKQSVELFIKCQSIRKIYKLFLQKLEEANASDELAKKVNDHKKISLIKGLFELSLSKRLAKEQEQLAHKVEQTIKCMNYQSFFNLLRQFYTKQQNQSHSNQKSKAFKQEVNNIPQNDTQSVTQLQHKIENLDQYLNQSYGSSLFDGSAAKNKRVQNEENSADLDESSNKKQGQDEQELLNYLDNREQSEQDQQQHGSEASSQKKAQQHENEQQESSQQEDESSLNQYFLNPTSDSQYKEQQSQSIDEDKQRIVDESLEQSNIDNQEYHEEESYDNFRENYIENKYKLTIQKKCFDQLNNNLKNKQKQKSPQQQQDSKDNYEILKKVFEGLRMYSRQKIMVRKYLQELQQEVHYYPHSIQQYRQFEALSKNT